MEESLPRDSFKMGFQPSVKVASGEVVEWLMALVLKTSDVKASVGSNPTLSVLFFLNPGHDRESPGPGVGINPWADRHRGLDW
jgi:hypothetical protein